MRSLAFTFVLGILAAIACGLVQWQLAGGSFDDLLGPPPVPVGQRVYTEFSAIDVKHIRVSQNGVDARFKLGDHGWEALSPWHDRMDPRLAVGIINFTLGMRVEDYAEADEIDPQTAGLGESRIDIRLGGADDRQLARFKLGRRTPWQVTVEDQKDPLPTVFIQRRDENQKRCIYACTGDISFMFRDGMSHLRDHHPFYFNPLGLRKLHLRTPLTEVTLTRESLGAPEIPATADHPGSPAKPASPWRITLPLESGTDRTAVRTLLEGLYQLEAVRVHDASAVTLPPATQSKTEIIALTSFHSDQETILEIFPPEDATATTVLATVSDRPNTVFELPLKAEAGLVGLTSLPRDVNDLRDPMLVNIPKANFDLLRRIVIQPASGPAIELGRTPPQRWMTTLDGKVQEANEERLHALLKTITQDGRGIGFESDAATDFSPWGLDRPILKLSFFTADETQSIHLNFGTDGKGNYFFNRQGSPTVMRVESGLLASISMRPYEWREARVWSIDRTNLRELARRTAGEPAILMKYDFNREQWTANQNKQDITALFNPSHANYLLGALEGLRATRWLSPDDASAEAALRQPSLGFWVLEDTTDDVGDVTGRITRELQLAPSAPGPRPAFYYGRLAGDPQPFMLDRDTYLKLATELVEPE